MEMKTVPAQPRLLAASMPDSNASVIALLRLFSESNSRKEYLDAAVQLLQQWSECRCVGIRVLDPDGNIPFESYTGFSQEFWASENWLSVQEDQCICIRVIKGTPEPQDMKAITPSGSFACGNTMGFVGDLSSEEQARFRGTCIRTGFTSVAVVPISHRGQILGAIHLADERAEWLPSGKVDLVEMVAPLTGEAIHRFSLEEDLRRSCEFQAALNALLRLSLEGVTVDEFIQQAEQTLTSLPWVTYESDSSVKLLEQGGQIPVAAQGHHVVPIQSGDATLGFITLRLRGNTRPRRQDEDAAGTIADILAGAIVRKRAQADRNQMEERLLRAQRLEMAGKVAGQVAHDLNNLITPLVGYPQLIKRHLPADHPAVAFCDAQLRAAKQMAAINEDLLSLGRRGRLRMQPVDLNHVVGMAVSEIGDPPGFLRLDAHLAPALPQINGEPSQLLRVIANLLSNAREAMDGGGLLTVKTERVCLEAQAGGYGQVPPGEYVRLTVSDTGAGIPPEIQDRIFDPFFSTKQSGRKSGSGLGLSIVQAIVEDHRGQVDLSSEPGRGTTFAIYLPVYQAG